MFAVLVAASLAVPQQKEKEKEWPEAAKKELRKFEGMWKAVKGVTNGNEETANGGNDVFIEFKGRKLLLGDKEVFEIAALDPSTDPKILDLKAVTDMGQLRKDAVLESIYKLDGDTLMLAVYIGEGKKRPEKFESPKDSQVVWMTLKREKP
jgi:uncharacterized protein (TIGR03067 family)